jgi:hypothetical protein
MKTSIETALKTLEILLENPEEMRNKAENAISHGKKANEILRKYMRLSSMPEWDYATQEKALLLKPEEITEFFEKSKAYRGNKLYAKTLSKFTTGLVQQSYNKGNNGFLLDAEGIKGLEDLCNNIEGQVKKPLEITAKGNSVKDFCACAQYCIITIENPDYKYGTYTTGCDFRVQGKSQAEKVVAGLRSGFKFGNGPTRHWCNIHNGPINRVYIIGDKKDELFWSEDCWQFKQEMEEHNEREARRRGPDYMEPD